MLGRKRIGIVRSKTICRRTTGRKGKTRILFTFCAASSRKLSGSFRIRRDVRGIYDTRPRCRAKKYYVVNITAEKKNGINTGRTAVCLISRGLTKRGKTNGLNSSCRRPGLNEIPANATRVFIRLFPFALFPVIIICSSEITYLVARRC